MIVQQVQIIDTRPDWMIKEDELMHCLHCRFFRRCVTRCGRKCKVLGGTVIPKLRR
ncbi:hypothetical protein CathTA2_2448 [Caldalkalibacillus thermarum TA2.A1]|uniref:Uncharacterized protein n=1 Tax=Caldalkalibacillus thermarum (strain TA2.A1) TaxID=986075 RepID=F5L9E3_CALTT|nr:hypothetical protein CathTA2_2448 [Caldalkalibacillus thermarum TA2.A1]